MRISALKTALFACANAAGVSGRFANTAWRCRRLLILCYHGVSLGDEHEWNPTLYISPRTLTRRFGALRRLGCAVLSLPEAIDRLYEKSLPKRAVVLTFDDGYYDFKAKALPLIEAHSYRHRHPLSRVREDGDWPSIQRRALSLGYLRCEPIVAAENTAAGRSGPGARAGEASRPRTRDVSTLEPTSPAGPSHGAGDQRCARRDG
jgi:hypothetical protein